MILILREPPPRSALHLLRGDKGRASHSGSQSRTRFFHGRAFSLLISTSFSKTHKQVANWPAGKLLKQVRFLKCIPEIQDARTLACKGDAGIPPPILLSLSPMPMMLWRSHEVQVPQHTSNIACCSNSKIMASAGTHRASPILRILSPAFCFIVLLILMRGLCGDFLQGRKLGFLKVLC